MQEEFEDTKGAIIIRISKKNREHNGQKKKVKRSNNNLQNITHNIKDRVSRSPLKTGGELMCSGRVGSSCSTNGTRRVNLITNPVICREWGKDREVFTTSGTYPWSFVTQIFQIHPLCTMGVDKSTIIVGNFNFKNVGDMFFFICDVSFVIVKNYVNIVWSDQGEIN